MQPITITSGPATRIRKRNQFIQFKWTSTKVILKRRKLGILLQWPKGLTEAKNEGPTVPHIYFCNFSNLPSSSKEHRPGMTAIFHIRLYGRFIEIKSNLKRKKLYRKNHYSNFLGGSLTNRDTGRDPMGKGSPRILKHASSRTDLSISTSITSVNRPVKQKKLSFCSIETNTIL